MKMGMAEENSLIFKVKKENRLVLNVLMTHIYSCVGILKILHNLSKGNDIFVI